MDENIRSRLAGHISEISEYVPIGDKPVIFAGTVVLPSGRGFFIGDTRCARIVLMECLTDPAAILERPFAWDAIQGLLLLGTSIGSPVQVPGRRLWDSAVAAWNEPPCMDDQPEARYEWEALWLDDVLQLGP